MYVQNIMSRREFGAQSSVLHTEEKKSTEVSVNMIVSMLIELCF